MLKWKDIHAVGSECLLDVIMLLLDPNPIEVEWIWFQFGFYGYPHYLSVRMLCSGEAAYKNLVDIVPSEKLLSP